MRRALLSERNGGGWEIIVRWIQSRPAVMLVAASSARDLRVVAVTLVEET
jgi:hypothetical protein